VYEVSVKDTAGASGGAGAGPDTADLPGAGCGDRARIGVAGSHPPVAGSSAGIVAGETGAIHQGEVEPASAGRVSGVTKTLLGAAHVGAGLLLCDGGSGGRGNDQSLYREPEMGRRRSGLQDHSAHRAFSRPVESALYPNCLLPPDKRPQFQKS
jgi:hypothetical protein